MLGMVAWEMVIPMAYARWASDGLVFHNDGEVELEDLYVPLDRQNVQQGHKSVELQGEEYYQVVELHVPSTHS
jgi:hypothetical protein